MGKRGPKPIPAAERFWPKVDKNGPVPDYAPELGRCWVWTEYLNSAGYARFMPTSSRDPNRYTVQAHRFAYEQVKGPIPEGLVLDHLCRVPRCVNPNHLEPVTESVNVRRGIAPAARWAARTHCDTGHEYTPENTYRTKAGARVCKTCRRDRKRLDRSTPEGRATYNVYMQDYYQRKLKPERSR